ncbi:unnamed protein product [Didymodactylos carnosus]|uniref:Uncharacterized protein n=2 Tax=Didymodactylos carnosus TaxID=1234261 RepID=A0A814N9C5_9BILA|nr:unnamed protein product [Didymodactylos carnosus]CAF3852933.1 unnamed protein product [Didymodactylos carnosus]
MAGIYFSQGDYDKTIEIFKDSDHPNDIHNRGLIYYRLRELEKALSCFIKALDLIPNEATILVSIGNVYKEKGENKNALDYYQRAIEIQENSKSWEIAQTFNNIGLIYYTQKEYNLAMNYFMKALDLVDLMK